MGCPPMPPELARRISRVRVLKPRATPSYIIVLVYLKKRLMVDEYQLIIIGGLTLIGFLKKGKHVDFCIINN